MCRVPGGGRVWGLALKDGPPMHGVLPHCPPPLWIPAFAGMTNEWGAGALGRWGPPMHWALPYSPPPLWIPAFAGMTMVGGRR